MAQVYHGAPFRGSDAGDQATGQDGLRRAPVGLTLGCVKASPQTQLRLLELADLDTELARLDHRRRGLPEVAELVRLDTRAGELKDALVATETELGDLSREQSRAER